MASETDNAAYAAQQERLAHRAEARRIQNAAKFAARIRGRARLVQSQQEDRESSA